MTMAWQHSQYSPASHLGEQWLRRLSDVPRKPDLLYTLRAAAALPVRGFLRTYHRLTIVGKENLPRTGSFVMVANHASHLDALCLLSAIPLRRLHRTFPAAAQDYFFVNRRRVALAAIFANAIPFGRKLNLRRSLEMCRALLAIPGNVLILFPEGTRTTTGELGEFRAGIGLLLAGTNVPVVPCAIQGAFAAWPKGAWLPRPRGVRLVIGKARRYADLPPGRGSSEHIAGELRGAVAEFLCQ
jgi:1-acyl-sn-glycerol-3-phosphate acyltransferase